MPKFDVTLTYTKTANISIEVSAKDDDAAQEKVEKMLQEMGWDVDKIATKFKADWDVEEENIEVESVEEQ